MPSCLFCKIAGGEINSPIVFEDRCCIAFLDHRPLFPGHTLLIPREHYETIADLPADLLTPLFRDVQLLARVIQEAMSGEGVFIGINNRVSQSVPHFHVHIVPRRKGDGLKGFFWPRRKYQDDAEIHRVQQAIRAAVAAVPVD